MELKEAKYHPLRQSARGFLVKDLLVLPPATAQPKQSVLRLRRDEGVWAHREGLEKWDLVNINKTSHKTMQSKDSLCFLKGNKVVSHSNGKIFLSVKTPQLHRCLR